MLNFKCIILGMFVVSAVAGTTNTVEATDLRVKMVVEESGEVLTDIVPSAHTRTMEYISTGEFQPDSTFLFRNMPERDLLILYHIGEDIWGDSVPTPIPQDLFYVYVPQKLVDTQHKTEVLGELNVEGRNQYTEGKKTTFIPTKKEKKISSGGIELLSNMALAQLRVDPMEGSVTTASGESISLYIDMQPASQQEVSMLRAMDIETVEFLVSPADPRFKGDRYVLNYVLVKYEYGGYTVLDGQQRFIRNAGTYNVYSRNTIGKMLYDISGGFEYSSDKHLGRELMNRYEFPDLTLEKISTDDEGHRSRRNGYGSMRATYQSEKMSIANTIGLSGMNIPSDRLHGMVRYNHPELYPDEDSYSFKHSSNFSLSWMGNYFFNLPNQFSLSLTPSASYSRYRNVSRYIENTEVSNDSRDKAWKYSLFAMLGKKIGAWEVGGSSWITHSGNSMTYSGTIASESHAHKVWGQTTAYANMTFNRFWANAKAGLTYQRSVTDGVAYNNVAPWYFIQAGYNINNHNNMVFYSHYSVFEAPQNMKSDNLVLMNNLEAMRGNPYLKNSGILKFGLTYNFNPNSRFGISAYWNFNRLSDAIVQNYTAEMFGGQPVMVQTFENNGFIASNDYGLNVSFKCLNSNLRLNAGLQGNTSAWHSVEHYNGTYLSYFGQATYMLNQFYISAKYSSRSKNVNPGTRSENPDYYMITAGWGNGDWNVMVTALNPTVGNYRSGSSLTEIGSYRSWSQTYSSAYHRQFVLSVRYSFSYGKKVPQGEQLGPVEGAGSALLNTSN